MTVGRQLEKNNSPQQEVAKLWSTQDTVRKSQRTLTDTRHRKTIRVKQLSSSRYLLNCDQPKVPRGRDTEH